MIESPYSSDGVDPIFKKIIKDIKLGLDEKDEDFLLFCCGTTGTGKSSLMLYAMDEYMEDKADIEYIGLNKKNFANALKKCKDSPLPRFCGNDEANISKRDHSTKYNKDMLELYYSIRGLQIFHWWNNPSLEMIDKPFIQERIKGFIFITTKDTTRPRIYYYFTKKAMLNIYDKYGTLDLKLLKKVCKEYAMYRGWFKKYKGKLWQPYLEKKECKMGDIVDMFAEKYGTMDNTMTTAKVGKMFKIPTKTINRYIAEMKQQNIISDDDIDYSGTGRKQIPEETIKKIEQYIQERKNKGVIAMHRKRGIILANS